MGSMSGGSEPPRRRKDRTNGPSNDEDLEYRLAVEASKNEAEEEKKRRQGGSQPAPDDDDLAKAIKLSKEEEDLRRRELEDNNNASNLFDFGNTPAQPAQPQPTGYNQGYQQQGAVDWFGNPINQQQQQPQNTGYVSNAYQPTGMQNQQTGFQNGFDYNNPYQQQQQTGFDQSQYQQQQPSYLQPQQTSFSMNNPYSQQNTGFGAQPQQQQQQQTQQQDNLQPGSQNPWATNNTSDSMKPQPTGSNNPFAASSINRPQTSSAAQRQPTLDTLHEQKTQTQFSQPFGQSFSSMPSQPTAQPVQQPQQPPNPHHANLNALLSSGEGQDTFGNTGNLRIPAQHTAPGTFINSAGAGINRMPANQTGSNPFMQSQFTGMPQQSHMAPAQTGPAGGFGGGGFGSSNPYAGGQQRQGQQGGSLIDL